MKVVFIFLRKWVMDFKFILMNDFFQLQLIIFVNVLFIIHCVTEKRRPPLVHALTDKMFFWDGKISWIAKGAYKRHLSKDHALKTNFALLLKKLVISRIDLAFHCSCAWLCMCICVWTHVPSTRDHWYEFLHTQNQLKFTLTYNFNCSFLDMFSIKKWEKTSCRQSSNKLHA